MHLIRLRGPWSWRTETSDGTTSLPITRWPEASEGATMITLTRRFSDPPGREPGEPVRLGLSLVPGLLEVRCNGSDALRLEAGPAGHPVWTDLAPTLQARNRLELRVELARGEPVPEEGWGHVVLGLGG
jgi:hypothetical protein